MGKKNRWCRLFQRHFGFPLFFRQCGVRPPPMTTGTPPQRHSWCGVIWGPFRCGDAPILLCCACLLGGRLLDATFLRPTLLLWQRGNRTPRRRPRHRFGIFLFLLFFFLHAPLGAIACDRHLHTPRKDRIPRPIRRRRDRRYTSRRRRYFLRTCPYTILLPTTSFTP